MRMIYLAHLKTVGGILLENATLIKFTVYKDANNLDFLASFTLHSLDELTLKHSVAKGSSSDTEGVHLYSSRGVKPEMEE